YRDGQGNTWTGRGKRPGWLVRWPPCAAPGSAPTRLP
ncbi:H-NS family nucleoid-associated regulatory protein, partial [Ralstonia pseudosolanacearum]